jgi:two-component system nitrogen regulation response regulator GlnG/two-component system response regulator HydG
MTGDASRTEPEEDLRGSARRTGEDVAALVIVWSADEPARVGEVALVAGATRAEPRVVGRGGPSSDSAEPRLVFGPFRGAGSPPGDWLQSPKISRVQLRIRPGEDGGLDVENVGRLKLSHNGMDVRGVLARPGDLLEIGAQLVLYVTRRHVGNAPRRGRDFPFGGVDPHGIVGESPAAWSLRERIAFVGPLSGHVLVHGASGTGKELVARGIHASSPRAARPFIARNAANFPEGLVDAELFGNAKNYPNPGMPERAGLVGDVHESTLFLDEFGELPQPLQAHLLRVLDAGEYQRLGESRMRRSDFRLVAATNRSLSALKHDVLARFVLRVDLPDLNARREDIPLLARHQLSRIGAEHPHLAERFFTEVRGRKEPRIGLGLMRELVTHTYLTNVRELEAMLWRSLAASQNDVLEATSGATGARSAEDDPIALTAARIQACLDEHNGMLDPARRALGLTSRHALARLIKKYGIEVKRRLR